MRSADSQSGVNKAYYKRALNRLHIPNSVVATSPDRNAARVFTGDGRSLLHDLWVLCTDDRRVKRNGLWSARHSAIVDIGGSRLSDPENLADKLTSKLLCHGLLTSGVGKPLSARSVFGSTFCFHSFLRWRNSLGIRNNSQLQEAHFDDFVARLGSGGVRGLFPIEERIERLEAALATGKYEYPRASTTAVKRSLPGTQSPPNWGSTRRYSSEILCSAA